MIIDRKGELLLKYKKFINVSYQIEKGNEGVRI